MNTFKIATGDSAGRGTHWFAKFMATSDWQYGAGENELQATLDYHESRANARGCNKIGDDIEFETEEDATLFILKWS